jgi:hypothetical protein
MTPAEKLFVKTFKLCESKGFILVIPTTGCIDCHFRKYRKQFFQEDFYREGCRVFLEHALKRKIVKFLIRQNGEYCFLIPERAEDFWKKTKI